MVADGSYSGFTPVYSPERVTAATVRSIRLPLAARFPWQIYGVNTGSSRKPRIHTWPTCKSSVSRMPG